jgi:uncharacterized membrane protein
VSGASQAVLVVVLELATSIWVGGLIAIAIVARVSARTLAPAERVAFFRGLGRTYGIVGTAALVIALASGAWLLADRPWDGTLTATAVVAGILLIAVGTGGVQARRMTVLRRRIMVHPDDDRGRRQVQVGARRAAILRGGITVLTLALVVLGSVLASSR